VEAESSAEEEGVENNATSEIGEQSRQAERDILAKANRLRHEGLHRAKEGDLELARELLDQALNTILESGLAVEAHPALQEAFLTISREAVAIDEQLSLTEEDVRENTLADELESVDTEELESEVDSTPPAITYDIPVVLNARVQHFIEMFQTEKRKEFAAGMARSGLYIDMFRRILEEEGVPQDLVYLAMIESAFKVRAYSRASAKGIWQFMSWTAKRYGLKINWWIDERSDPEKSCRAAARYLRDLHSELGDWLLAIAAYNGGPGRVGSAVKRLKTADFWEISNSSRHLRRETRNFVPAILAAAIIMKQPKEYGFGDVVLEQPLEYEKVRVDSPTDIRIAAELAEVEVTLLQELNPALRRMITPDDYKEFELRIPTGRKEIFETKFAALPAHKRLKYTEHIVSSGETLSAIAKRYHTSVTAIQRANDIRNPHKLSRGQHLIIPLSPGPGSEEIDSTRIAVQAVPKGTKVVHTVRRGESLYQIARAYGTTIGSIAAWNKINPSAPIYPGNRLTIIAGTQTGGSDPVEFPGGKIVHNVKQGDTLYDIANRYNISVAQLKRWNNLRRNLIRPGDQLTIYLKSGEGSSN
jgi:membrane-bound lytic murein transglycosylase D